MIDLRSAREFGGELVTAALAVLQPGAVAHEHRPEHAGTRRRQHLEAASVALSEPESDAHGVAGGDVYRARARGRRPIDQAASSSHDEQSNTGCHRACPCGVDLDPEGGAA